MRLGGAVLEQQIANPAAGAEWTFTVPAGQVMEILSLHWVLATSAAVANRVSGFEILDGAGNVVGIWRGGAVQAASLTENYSIGPFDGQSDPNGNFGAIIVPAPQGLHLPAGFTIRSLSQNLQAGDQYSQIWMAIELFNA